MSRKPSVVVIENGKGQWSADFIGQHSEAKIAFKDVCTNPNGDVAKVHLLGAHEYKQRRLKVQPAPKPRAKATTKRTPKAEG